MKLALLHEAFGDVHTSVIGGKRIKEKEGKLTADLGKPPSKASESEKQAYINAAKTPTEKRKRVARINLAAAHAKGTRAQKKTTSEDSFMMVHESK
jgi:hypothetical protein